MYVLTEDGGKWLIQFKVGNDLTTVAEVYDYVYARHFMNSFREMEIEFDVEKDL